VRIITVLAQLETPDEILGPYKLLVPECLRGEHVAAAIFADSFPSSSGRRVLLDFGHGAIYYAPDETAGAIRIPDDLA
jgi:hypothetical protein